MNSNIRNYTRVLCLFLGTVLLLKFSTNLQAQNREPLHETYENSARYRWENKVVLDSLLLDNAESLTNWTHDDFGTMTLTNARSIDGVSSIHLFSKTKGDSATADNRPWGYCSAIRKINNQNWNNKWNRVSMWIYPDAPGHETVTAYIYVKTNNSSVRSRDNIVLKNQQWNYVVSEVEWLNRSVITAIEVRCRLSGNEPGTSDSWTYDIDHLMLEKVEPDQFTGWTVAPNKISFSHSGYSLGAPKTAIANNLAANEFHVVNAATSEIVLTKSIELDTTYRGVFQKLDFTELNVPGTYYLQVGTISTRNFRIDQDVWIQPLMKALNFYYVLRAGYAVPGYHGESNKDWRAVNKDKSVSLCGGWYDAGDLSQGLYNTSEGTLILFRLAEQLGELKKNEELKQQLIDEATWGLDWLQQTTLHDGLRPQWAVQGWWSDGIIGNSDDCISNFGRSTTNFMTAAAAEAVAYRVLKSIDPVKSSAALKTAEEDWTFAMNDLVKYVGREAVCESAASACIASIELFKSTGNQKYANQALSMAPYLVNAQQRTYVEGSKNLTGFLYETGAKTTLLHSVDGSGAHEHAQIIAMAALCEAFPDHTDYMKWYSGVAMYSEMYKKITANTAPYNMLPSGVYHKTDLSNWWNTIYPLVNSQLSAAQKVASNYVVTAMPVGDPTFGQLHLQLSQAKGIAMGAQLRGDLEGSQLAEQQLEWTLGKNPFSASFMHGEGYDYIPMYTPMNGNVVGALPVGMATIGSSDKPYWQPGANEPSPHEQWIQTVNRFVYLASELIGPAILNGNADSVVVITNELSGEKIEVQPENGQFTTSIPQGRYVVRTNKLDHHIVAMPNRMLKLNSTLDFVVSSVRDTDSTKTRNVILSLVANGSGQHTFAVRTSNLSVTTPEKEINLQPGIEQTITWSCTIPDENEPSYAIVVPNGDINQKKEVAILEIPIATVPETEPEGTGNSTKIVASQDTYVDNTAPTTVKNTAISTFASYAPGIATPKIRDSYFKFDLSRFTPDSAVFIKQVKFQLKVGYVSDPTKSQKLIVRDVNKPGLDVDALTFDGLASAGLKSVPFYLDNKIVTDFTAFPAEKELGSQIAQIEGNLSVDQLIEFDLTDYIKWAIVNKRKEVILNLAKDVASDDGFDNRAWFHTIEATAVNAAPPVLAFGYNSVSSDSKILQGATNWKVYPSLANNGTIGIKQIHQNETSSIINIYSITGALVKSLQAKSFVLLNVCDFKAGTYFVDINSEKRSEKHRFIVYN